MRSHLDFWTFSYRFSPKYSIRKILPITFIFARNFRAKPGTPKKRQKLIHVSRNNKNNFNDDEPTFFSYFFKLSSATVFVASAFALTDFWESLTDSTTRFFRFLLSSNRDIQIDDFLGTAILLIGSNVATYLMWLAPSLREKMMRFAVVSRNSGVAQMLFAAFSHANLLHIFLNMYVMLSFIQAWERYATTRRHTMPQDLMSPGKFFAFYLSAGVVANAGSIIVRNIGRIPGRSLGASGAVLGLVGYICTKIPDGRLSIAFLPQYSFTAKSGLIGMAIFDSAGLVFGALTKWRYMFFDHAAHLSGLLFGLWYARYGEVILYRWSDFSRRMREEIFGKR